MRPRHSLFTVLYFLLSILFLSFCVATKTPTQTVSVYATSSAQGWLAQVYSCADNLSIAVKIETNHPDIYLQIGEPSAAALPAYKIGEEEILVAANNASPIQQDLSLSAIQDLFARENPAAQVWVFSSGEDIQRAFDSLVMNGIRVTSSARVAASVELMSVALSSQSNAVGVLPKRALAGNLRGVFSAGVVPVLAITKEEPQGIVSALIDCLQK